MVEVTGAVPVQGARVRVPVRAEAELDARSRITMNLRGTDEKQM